MIELAPIDLVPYSVYYFLEMVGDHWFGGAFHRIAGHVLQTMTYKQGTKKPFAFQEYHPGFPHKKYTFGYAGMFCLFCFIPGVDIR